MCDRVLWVDHGRLRLDGPMDEVLEAYAEATGRPCPPGAEAGVMSRTPGRWW